MYKKFLALLMSLLMVLGNVVVFGATGDITVYLSVSRYGDFVEDKSGNLMTYVPVTLSSQEAYTLDDVFAEAHEIYYEGGLEGYASSVTESGLFGIDCLWGDTSQQFGYQINCGSEMVLGLGHYVEDGDYIDAFIYKNTYPLTEGYSRFQHNTERMYMDESLLLTLTYNSGYDENWNTIVSPCERATITVNGEETEFITDENGEVRIQFDETGEYIVSAKLSKLVDAVSVPAITAPCCIVTVQEHRADYLLHNIAETYMQCNFEEAGGNLPWILADMTVYEELFPESVNILTEERKKEGLSLLVDLGERSEKAGDLAKAIIALRALGYDAEKVYTKEFKKENFVQKLINIVENQEELDVYTLPYVIIALSQSETYVTEEQIHALISSALDRKELWQSTEFGTDGLTPMLLALAPFRNDERVSDVLEETVTIVKSEQRTDGLIDGFEGYESASTGLAICGLAAVGVDAKDVKNDDSNLLEGLISTANESLSAFPNAFATEQGFRGLLAWRLLTEHNGKRMYDFSDCQMIEANVPGTVFCPVFFEVTPANASISLESEETVSPNCFDLQAGSYNYSISASGYHSKDGMIEITLEEEECRTPKYISISLSKIQSSGRGNSSIRGGIIGKEPSKTEQSDVTSSEEEPSFTAKTFSDVQPEDWFYPAVQYVYEHQLFQGTDHGFEPNTVMSRAMLVTVLHRLSGAEEETADHSFEDVPDDVWYAQSVQWAASNGLINGESETAFMPNNPITREQLSVILYRFANHCKFNTDAKNDSISGFDFSPISNYAKEAMAYAVGTGIISGKPGGDLAPGEYATRAEVATMLMRFVEVNKK